MSKATVEQASSEAIRVPGLPGPATKTIPTVEIFASQQPILIRQGQTMTITITGSVYDQPFEGDITLQPSPDFATGCPLFGNVPFNGVYKGVSFPVGNNTVQLALVVTGPTNLPPGPNTKYTCTLRYDAEQNTFAGPVPVGKGNLVKIQYTLKRKKLPGEPDDV